MIKPATKRMRSYVDDADMKLPAERELIDIVDLGHEIQARRKALGYGQIPFANLVQVSAPTIAKLEAGKATEAGVVKLDRIARGLGITLSELIKSVE